MPPPGGIPCKQKEKKMKTTATIVLDYSGCEYEDFCSDRGILASKDIENGLFRPYDTLADDDIGDRGYRHLSDNMSHYPCMVLSMDTDGSESRDALMERFMEDIGHELKTDDISIIICGLDNLNEWAEDYCYSDLDLVEAALRNEPKLFRMPWLIEEYISRHIESLNIEGYLYRELRIMSLNPREKKRQKAAIDVLGNDELLKELLRKLKARVSENPDADVTILTLDILAELGSF